jgi:hypothetical protein
LFCNEQGVYCHDSRVFGRKLSERGYERGHWDHKKVRGFVGVRVRPVGAVDPYGAGEDD